MTDSLSELFSRDPLSYAKQDIETIIARLREARAQFVLGGKAEKTKKPKAAAAPVEGKLNLEDLGL